MRSFPEGPQDFGLGPLLRHTFSGRTLLQLAFCRLVTDLRFLDAQEQPSNYPWSTYAVVSPAPCVRDQHYFVPTSDDFSCSPVPQTVTPFARDA
jgi:hypothetical protein